MQTIIVFFPISVSYGMGARPDLIFTSGTVWEGA